MLVAGRGLVYDPGHFLITSLDSPAYSQVVDARPTKPCLGLMLKLDLQLTAELIMHAGMPQPPTEGRAGMGIGSLTSAILEPVGRLVGLLDEPAAINVLAPLIQREIHYRLLMSDQAVLLWQAAAVGGQGHRISKAIDWLKLNFASSLRVEELADRVQMSASNFHHHFRQLTGMSPLQYQKWLRLNEARRLMLNDHLDAGSAAFRVGYESPSQFSREYSRLFGIPPKRDVVALSNRPLAS